ncbi:aldose epimerase family protein [Mucilaginibacter sp. UR6-1]|uniref:aldose epimerase family protein n=1 Tax=Mucilaginibacter sp. UR6-1 TaxID=1435643 RepID=UPI001E402CF3|nr:aldose epimerase family protein [Mucilaginibacter sp. UR6-1]
MKNKSVQIIMSLVIATAITACGGPSKQTAENTDTVTADSTTNNIKGTVDGKEVSLYTLKNSNGVSVGITNYGGRVVSLNVPDKDGKFTDVVLGYDSLKSYQKKGEPYFGALIGRYGNRIAKGKFTLDGKPYQLDINDGVNTLHGGFKGFFCQVWDVKKADDKTLELSYVSKDGEGGYPGTLTVDVTYELTNDNELKIAYKATTDIATVVNLTNHAYFNLNGHNGAAITNHQLYINADKFTPVDATLIPTGKLQAVKGTPFDFTAAKAIGKDIEADDQQLKFGKGYDHNFVLNQHDLEKPVATVSSPETGISMEVYTTEPGVQFYSGNFLNGADKDGKGGVAYGHRSALCLETQHFPDSPNQPTFPTTTLKPGQEYKTYTIYKFLTAK